MNVGWTYYHKPVGVKAVDSILREFGYDWCAKHVNATTATREAVFLVVERHDPDSNVYVPDADGNVRALGVIKYRNVPKARDGFNFGYKDMSETMGPYGCEAPLSILAQCSELRPLVGEPDGYSGLKSATEYRARCARKAAALALKRGLKPGAKVILKEPLSFGGKMLQTFTVERARVRGRRGISTVFRSTTCGTLCSISADQLVGATVESTNEIRNLRGVSLPL